MTYRNFFAAFAVACVGMVMLSDPGLAMASSAPIYDGGSVAANHGPDMFTLLLRTFSIAVWIAIVALAYAYYRSVILTVCAALLVGSLAVAFPVMAQTATPANTYVSAGGLFGIIQPFVLELVSVVVGLAITFAVNKFRQWTNIQVSQKWQDDIHRAAVTGVSAGLARAGTIAADFKIDTHSTVLADAAAWVEQSVPDALKGLGVTPETIKQLVLAKVTQIAETGTTPIKGMLLEGLAPAKFEPELSAKSLHVGD